MRMNRRALLGGASAGVGLLILTDCSSDSNSGGSGKTGPVVVAYGGSFTTLEPHTFKSLSAFAATGALYEPLLRRSFTEDDGILKYASEVQPGIVERTTLDTGDVQLVVRDSAKFQNGDPVTADDVIYTLKRAMLGPGYVGALPHFMGIDSPDQLQVVDDKTALISAPRTSPILDRLLTFQTFTPLDSKVAAEHATSDDEWTFKYFATNPVANGPMRLKDYDPERQLVLEPNPDALASAKSSVILQVVADAQQRAQLVEKGQVDVATELPPRLVAKAETTRGLNVLAQPATRVKLLGMNMKVAPFDQLAARQAIAHAVPYDALIDDVMQGYAKPAKNIVPTTMETYDSSVPSFDTDLDKAKNLVTQAGLDGTKLTLSTRTSSIDESESAVRIQESFRQVGIDAEIQQLADADFATKLTDRSMGLFLNSFGSWGEDPLYQLYLNFKTGGALNWTQFSDPDYDQLVDEGLFETDPARRAEISSQLQQMVYDTCPMAFLYVPDLTFVYRDGIEGVGTLDYADTLRLDQLTRISG
jgi:peptide/nickel transport system substrate-binding protein